MNELSLFTGAGGGVLGTHHLLGWKTCGYVEWNEYCQRVIAARIADGYLTSAPIFTDVREFVQSGAAEQYRGIADVVTAGFPCTPWSSAGRQLGGEDANNMWPATRDVIRLVYPPSVLLENVPRLISSGYIGTVLGDLASLGYMGRWGILSAKNTGPSLHLRERVWICAHTNSSQRKRRRISFGVQPEYANSSNHSWWKVEPAVDRVANGLADQLERLKAIGNGQIPGVVARAWRELAI